MGAADGHHTPGQQQQHAARHQKRTRGDDDGSSSPSSRWGGGRTAVVVPPACAAPRPVAYNTMAQAYASAAVRALNAGLDHPDAIRQAILFRGEDRDRV